MLQSLLDRHSQILTKRRHLATWHSLEVLGLVDLEGKLLRGVYRYFG